MLFSIKNRLLTNFFSLGSVQLINSLLQLMVIQFVIRKLGPEGFGVIAVAQVVMFYLSAFTEYGFSQTATREVALNRSDPAYIASIFFRVIFTRLILCVIAFVLFAILLLSIPVFRDHEKLYITGFVFVIGQSLLLTWFFQGLEKMQIIAFATLIARVIFVAMVFLLIRNPLDGWWFLFSLGIGNIIAGLFCIGFAMRTYRIPFRLPVLSGIADELRAGWQLMLANISISTCQYANVFILRIFTNDLTVGYYSIAERIFFTIRQLLGVFTQAVYPQVCQLVRQGRAAMDHFFRRIYAPFLLVVFCSSLLLFVFSPWVIYFFMGQSSGDAVLFLRVFCVAAVVVCLNIPGTLLLLATDRKKDYFRVYLIATVLNVLLNSLLAWQFQGTGTVVAVLATEVFILACFGIAIYRSGAINILTYFPKRRQPQDLRS